MKTKLYKSVVTNNKVAFIEAAVVNSEAGPVAVQLRLPKEQWLELGRPETIRVEVSNE